MMHHPWFNVYFIIFVCYSLPLILSENIYSNYRIVGGQNADISNYPYQVSLQLDNKHFCGGSILNQNFILTAAHCTYDIEKELLSIRVNSSIRNAGGTLYQVSKIIVHSKFNNDTLDYDISILKLSNPLTFGAGVRSIMTATPGSQIIDGLQAQATGWGKLGENKPVSDYLQVVTLPVISTKTCNKYYPQEFVTERMFCAGYDKGGKDTCDGDSGGPLVIAGIQIGITSWGLVCAAAKYPGTYTNLPLFYNYIQQVINTN